MGLVKPLFRCRQEEDTFAYLNVALIHMRVHMLRERQSSRPQGLCLGFRPKGRQQSRRTSWARMLFCPSRVQKEKSTRRLPGDREGRRGRGVDTPPILRCVLPDCLLACMHLDHAFTRQRRCPTPSLVLFRVPVAQNVERAVQLRGRACCTQCGARRATAGGRLRGSVLTGWSRDALCKHASEET